MSIYKIFWRAFAALGHISRKKTIMNSYNNNKNQQKPPKRSNKNTQTHQNEHYIEKQLSRIKWTSAHINEQFFDPNCNYL